MEKTLLIAAAILLALVSYFALARPITIVRFLHAGLSVWARLFSSSVLTHEQSSRIELARSNPREYEFRYYTQITVLRAMGLIAVLMVAGLLCMALTR